MKVLIVCVTYGRIPFLNRMLASFLSQTYSNKHLVIVNDDKNIKLDCDLKNVTCININNKILLGEKRNIGSCFGKSDLIMHLDDDDIFLPERIQNHVDQFETDKTIDLFYNNKSFIIYGDSFEVSRNSVMHCAFLTKAFYEVGGFKHLTNKGEDTAFFNSIKRKKIVTDDTKLDFVYNYGGINYHISGNQEDEVIEKIAYNQLKDLDLINKTYVIKPDFVELDKFIQLKNIYNKTNKKIKVEHVSLGKIKIVK